MPRLGAVGEPLFPLTNDLIDEPAGHAEGIVSDNELVPVMDEFCDRLGGAHPFIFVFGHTVYSILS
jgi:hypothetical protein